MADELGRLKLQSDDNGDDEDLDIVLLSQLDANDGTLSDYSPVGLPDGTPITYLSPSVAHTASFGHDQPSMTALHALEAHLCVHAITRTTFYQNIRAISPDKFGPTAPLRAHTDGGSMATTTNRKSYLWYYCKLSPVKQRPILRVADSREHHPVGIGFLRVPTKGSPGSHMARCFYTPTLPATILSPSSMARDHRCTGYSTMSTFAGDDCCVCLMNMDGERPSADIVIPQTLIHDLLFTQPLLPPPTASKNASTCLPPDPDVLPTGGTDTCHCSLTSCLSPHSHRTAFACSDINASVICIPDELLPHINTPQAFPKSLLPLNWTSALYVSSQNSVRPLAVQLRLVTQPSAIKVSLSTLVLSFKSPHLPISSHLSHRVVIDYKVFMVRHVTVLSQITTVVTSTGNASNLKLLHWTSSIDGLRSLVSPTTFLINMFVSIKVVNLVDALLSLTYSLVLVIVLKLQPRIHHTKMVQANILIKQLPMPYGPCSPVPLFP